MSLGNIPSHRNTIKKKIEIWLNVLRNMEVRGPVMGCVTTGSSWEDEVKDCSFDKADV